MKTKHFGLKFFLFSTLVFLLSFSLFAGNKYVISLDGGESFYVNDGNDQLDVSNAWTFEAWVNVHSYTSGDYDCIMDRRTVFSFYLIDDDDKDYAIAFAARNSSDGIIAYMDCDGSGSTSADMEFDTWYHVAATYDGSTARLYVNGTEYDSDTDPDWVLSASTNALNIGGRYWGRYERQMKNADIDEVRVSNIARTISEMQTDNSSEEYESDTHTVLLMHLNDNDQGDPPTYISGTGLNGTTGDDNISSVDYITLSTTNRLLQPKYQSKTSGNWSDNTTWEYWDGAQSNWSDATLTPDYADDDITILNGHTVTISTDIRGNEIIVENSGTLTISSGKTLTVSLNDNGLSISGNVNVNGTLLLNSGSNLVINSNSSYTGSMIVAGTITNNGTITINRYLTNYSTNENGWHFLSAPVSNFNISGSDFEPVSGNDDLYEYDETATNNNWLNYTGGTFGDSQFQTGKGYLVAYKNAATKQFTGDINTGTITKNLSYTSNSANPGWNLLGNPYTSAIDWDEITKSTDVYGSVYVIRATDGSYISWNGSSGDLAGGIIPSMQGFFVKTSSTGQSITMEVADQVHSTGTYYKKSSGLLSPNSIKINVTSETGESNEYIEFRNDATKFFDPHCDAYKFFGFSKAPQIYTNDGENLYSINCLPFSMEHYDLPLGIVVSHTGMHTVTFYGMENINNLYQIELEDLKTGKTSIVTPNFTYSFNVSENDNPDRFILHFYNVNSVHNIVNTKENIVIYSYHNNIVVKSANSENLNGIVTIKNLVGQTLFSKQIINTPFVNFSTHLQLGNYIIQYSGNNGTTQSKKIMLQ